MYILIKDENCFDKYLKICGKVSNIIKKLIVNWYIIKNI